MITAWLPYFKLIFQSLCFPAILNPVRKIEKFISIHFARGVQRSRNDKVTSVCGILYYLLSYKKITIKTNTYRESRLGL